MIINLDFTILLKAFCQNGKFVICNSKNNSFSRSLWWELKLCLPQGFLYFKSLLHSHKHFSLVYICLSLTSRVACLAVLANCWVVYITVIGLVCSSAQPLLLSRELAVSAGEEAVPGCHSPLGAFISTLSD